MKGYVYKTDFAERFHAFVRTQGLTPEALQKSLLEFIQGFTQGCTEQAARSLLIVFRVRGLAVKDADRERILAQKDLERLERWLEKAVVAASVAAVIDEED
jgi:hypothetical protein